MPVDDFGVFCYKRIIITVDICLISKVRELEFKVLHRRLNVKSGIIPILDIYRFKSGEMCFYKLVSIVAW